MKSPGIEGLTGKFCQSFKEDWYQSSLLLTWGQTMVEAMKIMATSFKSSMHALLDSVLQACSRPLPTQATTKDSWTLMGKSDSANGQCWDQIDNIICSQRWSSSIQSAKTIPVQEADCGSDNELLIVKFRLKLKKIGQTTRPFRYELNQIPYNYTVEVTNMIEGIRSDRVPEELWTEVCDIVQEAGIKNIPNKKKYKKGKMFVWGVLTNSCEKKWKAKEKRKTYQIECRVLKNSKDW